MNKIEVFFSSDFTSEFARKGQGGLTMSKKIWIGKKKMFDEPCRAQLLDDTVYIVDDEEHLTGDGDRTRNIFDFSIDEAVSLANWILETVDQSKGDE